MKGKTMTTLWKIIFVLAGFSMLLVSCKNGGTGSSSQNSGAKTWGEKLGYPADKRVLILHADDIGMCEEANKAVIPYLLNDQIQSAAIMMPCAYADEFAEWYKEHPSKDIGLHLTLTSEWKTWRWGPVADPKTVPGLVDKDGYFWHDVPDVVKHASPEEVSTEIRAQIDKALSLGIKPGHIDTHMGTLYGSLGFSKAYLQAAIDYKIPAMAIEFTEPVVKRFRAQGYPITDELIKFAANYPFPKLDDFWAVPAGDSYAAKKENFKKLVKSLKPGITEIIFHPSIETDNLKTITNSWQQRVWEAQMFADPEIIQFFKDEGILFTNWKEIMKRFNGLK